MVSYDLAVWEGPQPGGDVEACAAYDRLYEDYLEGDESDPTPAIVAFAEELAARWAEASDGRTSAWDPLLADASGPMIYLTMPYGMAPALVDEAARLAAAHGLVCFDPQTERLCPGPGQEHRPGRHRSARGVQGIVDRFLAGEVGSERLPLLAAEALAEGSDSPALRELAGLSSAEVREARDLLARAATEAGAVMPGTGRRATPG